MIVDDHPIVREGLKTYLELSAEITVVAEADSLKTAMALLHSHQPEVILLDLDLPDGSGLELLKHLQDSAEAPKVVVLTSFLEATFVREAMRLGAAGYLLKHTGQGRLVDSIKAVMRGEMPMDASVVKILTKSQPDPLEQLTKREREVLSLIAQGHSNKAIAKILVIAEKTVKTHVSHILAKLDLSDRVKAALYAKDHGL
jgi:DNA-binding NarL/FixJ family response regulator